MNDSTLLDIVKSLLSMFLFAYLPSFMEQFISSSLIKNENSLEAIINIISTVIILIVITIINLFKRPIIKIQCRQNNLFWDKEINITRNELLQTNNSNKFSIILNYYNNKNLFITSIINLFIWLQYKIVILSSLKPNTDDLFISSNSQNCQALYSPRGFKIDITEDLNLVFQEKKDRDSLRVISSEIAFNQDISEQTNISIQSFAFEVSLEHPNFRNKLIPFIMKHFIVVENDSVEIKYNSHN